MIDHVQTVKYVTGDTRDVTAAMPDGSVDLILTSPPFLALRSYLPADHPDKWREIGSEPTPAQFIDTLLELTAEWRRVLAPHGSIAVELGDTYSGSGGAGGDYNANGLREGQAKFDGSGRRSRSADVEAGILAPLKRPGPEGRDSIPGWPLAKCKAMIPELYRIALAYGINPLTGAPSPAGTWRVRNVVTWCRPNPPVGALGDKYRPATSDMVIATTSPRRWFDLDAVRRPGNAAAIGNQRNGKSRATLNGGPMSAYTAEIHAAGAPPLDYWAIPPTGYKGSHYAVYPPELCRIPIESMCPREVCRVCGEPRRRITKLTPDDKRRQELANYLSSRRVAKGLTVKDVAAHFPSKTGGLTGCVFNWEQGDNVPTEQQWSTLKTLLDLNDEFDDLVSGERTWTIDPAEYVHNGETVAAIDRDPTKTIAAGYGGHSGKRDGATTRVGKTLGWTDCEHDNYRPGIVFDPFGGSGTTGVVAAELGRDAILVDLDSRNVALAAERIGPHFIHEQFTPPTAPPVYDESEFPW